MATFRAKDGLELYYEEHGQGDPVVLLGDHDERSQLGPACAGVRTARSPDLAGSTGPRAVREDGS